MDLWLQENPLLIGWVAGCAMSVAVVGGLRWLFRRDRRKIFTVGEYLGAFVLLLPFLVARIELVPVRSPGLDAFVVMAQLGLVFALATVITHVRSSRAERRDRAAAELARAAIPSAAREYFASEGFQRELGGITEAHPPTPETASDVIAYWVFRALDSAQYVEWSRLIFYATAVKGWRVATPTLSGTVPWLVAPFQASGDKQWDPSVDRDFREYGGATLIARFGMPVPA